MTDWAYIDYPKRHAPFFNDNCIQASVAIDIHFLLEMIQLLQGLGFFVRII
jgi:hypothetical protein